MVELEERNNMKKIVVATTNEDVYEVVQEAVKKFSSFESLLFATTETAEIYINYELPEIKVLDFTSGASLDCQKILDDIRNDRWLHTGGVIAVCKNRQQIKELEEQRDVNILASLTKADFMQHFSRLLRILKSNSQFLYTRGMQDVMGGIEQGSFTCGNDPMDLRFYMSFLVSYLYNTNRISIDECASLRMTFMELLINAVEHGNLEISYEEKTKWRGEGKNFFDLIALRSREEKYKDRKVKISYSIHKKHSAFRIHDDGNGFDWRKYLSKKGLNTDTHGRGISLSKSIVRQMEYNEKGNEVTFCIDNNVDASNAVPEIMSRFDVMKFKNKDIICKQDDPTNDLYFIVSGQLAVYTNDRLTTILTPNDMFIGEMSFLLNNRRTATIMAMGDCQLIKVPKTEFLALIRRNPHSGIFLSKMLAQRLENQSQYNYALMQKLADIEEVVNR